jgi:hypothetical protein
MTGKRRRGSLKAGLRKVDHVAEHGGAVMATTTNTVWVPTAEEVRRIVAELRPVIDECVSRSHKFLDGAAAHQR